MVKLCKCFAFFHLILSSSKKKKKKAEELEPKLRDLTETFLKWLFGTAVESTFYAVEQHKEINILQNGWSFFPTSHTLNLFFALVPPLTFDSTCHPPQLVLFPGNIEGCTKCKKHTSNLLEKCSTIKLHVYLSYTSSLPPPTSPFPLTRKYTSNKCSNHYFK